MPLSWFSRCMAFRTSYRYLSVAGGLILSVLDPSPLSFFPVLFSPLRTHRHSVHVRLLPTSKGWRVYFTCTACFSGVLLFSRQIFRSTAYSWTLDSTCGRRLSAKRMKRLGSNSEPAVLRLGASKRLESEPLIQN